MRVLRPTVLFTVWSNDTTRVTEDARFRGDVSERTVAMFHFTRERSFLLKLDYDLATVGDPANLIAMFHDAVEFAVFAFGIHRYGVAVDIKPDSYGVLVVLHSYLFYFAFLRSSMKCES